MKKVLTAAMALGLLATSAPAALAQDGERGERWRRGEGEREGRGDYNPAIRRSERNTPDNRAQAAPSAQAPPRVQAPPQVQASPDDRRARGDRDRSDRDRDWSGGDRGGEPRWSDRERGDRDWTDRRRAERPRYDRRAYPPVYRTDRRFHGPRYRPPSGFYARSWSYGHILPRGWYASQYRLMDWWSYGLPIPPAGYDWVRVGDDALLVDSFTGRVVQVVYDLFW